MWWSESLRKSTIVNGNHTLRVLTEEQFEVDVVKPTPSNYINYPALREGVENIKDGYYHLNIQTSAKLFTGFMWVNDGNLAWWGTDNTDNVYAGIVGDYDTCFKMIGESIMAWHHAASYHDSSEGEWNCFDFIRI